MTGKVALVTGASRGIGAATARAFHSRGASVVLAARDATALNRVARGLPSGHEATALAVPTDVTDPDSVDGMVRRVIERFGRLDFACNAAGGSGHAPTPLAEVPPETFDAGLAANLRGVFLSMRAEIPAVIRSGGGAIVNISSTAGLQGVGGLASYVAAKHGVEGLTKVGALDYARLGVRINAVAPGPILTENLLRAGDRAQRAAASALPVNRVGRPEEVAAAVVWLCSHEAEFLAGTTLTLDGGKLAGTPPFQSTAQPRVTG